VEVRKAVVHSARGEPDAMGEALREVKRVRVRRCGVVMSLLSPLLLVSRRFVYYVWVCWGIKRKGGRWQPSGNNVSFNLLDSFSGYGARNGGGGLLEASPEGDGGTGGIVERGFGDVRASTRAAAKLSA
jgi:hypothetical protein